MAQSAQPSPLQLSHIPEGKECLARTLDDLLERYLHLLHRYQALHQDLCRDLSAGYISLAQANFSNSNRIRYGQDFYDERMQAKTHVSVGVISPTFSIILPPNISSTQPSEDISAKNLQLKPNETLDDRDDCAETPKKASILESEPSPRDPLNWFGILLPPALRQSQAAFKSAATGTIPSLASTVKEMKDIELEVRRTRKRLRRAG